MTDMAKIEAERRALPLGVLKRRCRTMAKGAGEVGGFVYADAVIDEYMIYAARAGGDSAVVIDMSAVDREKASFFFRLAGFVGIPCVFQVRTFSEVSAAVSIGASAVQIPDAEGASALSGTVPEGVRCFLPADCGHARPGPVAVPALRDVGTPAAVPCAVNH